MSVEVVAPTRHAWLTIIVRECGYYVWEESEDAAVLGMWFLK